MGRNLERHREIARPGAATAPLVRQQTVLNILKPTGNFTYHQVYQSRILNADHVAFMCSVWISEQTTTFSLYNIKRLSFITEVETVYCAVRTEPLHNTDTFRL